MTFPNYAGLLFIPLRSRPVQNDAPLFMQQKSYLNFMLTINNVFLFLKATS